MSRSRVTIVVSLAVVAAAVTLMAAGLGPGERAAGVAVVLALTAGALTGWWARQALREAGPGPGPGFGPRALRVEGGFTVTRPMAEVFELFSPLGETAWVPGWTPELLHPPGASWVRGLIFRTPGDGRDVVWVVTQLDRDAGQVEYQRVDPGGSAALVSVSCTPRGGQTEVRVSYAYVGLSERGNRELAGLSQESHARRMEQWRGWIEDYLARGGAAPPR